MTNHLFYCLFRLNMDNVDQICMNLKELEERIEALSNLEELKQNFLALLERIHILDNLLRDLFIRMCVDVDACIHPPP